MADRPAEVLMLVPPPLEGPVTRLATLVELHPVKRGVRLVSPGSRVQGTTFRSREKAITACYAHWFQEG